MALKLTKLSAALTAANERTFPFTMERCKAPQPDGTMAAIVLHILPGTKDNQSFRNALLLLSMATKPEDETFTLETMQRNDERDMAIFAEHIVRGWSNAYDDEGNAIPYSKDAALELLTLLSSEFYKLRMFATNEANFIEPVDIAAVTKN